MKQRLIKRWIGILAIMIFTIAGTGIPGSVYAEPKTAQIANLEQSGDLAVLFQYDKEIVDITFLSPSGDRITKESQGVTYSDGDLWRSYRIAGAQAGAWSVEYDLGANTQIQYSVIEDDLGIWIQYVTPGQISGSEMKVNFEADMAKTADYQYELFAVNTKTKDDPVSLKSGYTPANADHEEVLELSELSGGNYKLRLEVSYRNGDAVIYDSMTTDAFDYTNPEEKEALEDYRILVDQTNRSVTVDWEDCGVYSDCFRLIVTGKDGEEIYNTDFENQEKSTKVYYPEDTDKLDISLSYRSNGIFSAPKTVAIDLKKGEQLKLEESDITSSAQAKISYSVSKTRTLSVSVYGDQEDRDDSDLEPSEYRLKEDGYLSVDLQEGVNRIYAEFESEDQIFYVIDKEVYYDNVPPQIILFEELDEKTFFDKEVHILGKVTHAEKFYINDKEVKTEENGNFDYLCKLSGPQTVVTMEAESVTGNRTGQKITLYKGSAFTGGNSKKGYLTYLPLGCALFTSLVVTIFSMVYMKRARFRKKSRSLAACIMADLLLLLITGGNIAEYILHVRFADSVKYLELAEKSASRVADFLKTRDGFGIAAIVSFVLFLIMLFVTVMVIKHRKKRKLQREEPQKVQEQQTEQERETEAEQERETETEQELENEPEQETQQIEPEQETQEQKPEQQEE